MADEKQTVSEADAAYAHAVEVCNRLVRELEAQLPPNYEPRRTDHAELQPTDRRRSAGSHPGQFGKGPGACG